MKQPSFTTSLFDCDDSSSLTLRTGSRFVRKLPDEGSLGYLHKFYAPLPDGAGAALLRRLPHDYMAFLEWANGAALFDNCIALFGYVETIARDTAPEGATAISLSNENEVFALVERQRWEQGWTKIGSLVGWDSTYTLQINGGGRCAVVAEEIACTTSSFNECLTTIVERVAPCFSCEGIIDGSYAELEAALASLVRPQ
jgi:hypothetical protein